MLLTEPPPNQEVPQTHPTSDGEGSWEEVVQLGRLLSHLYFGSTSR